MTSDAKGPKTVGDKEERILEAARQLFGRYGLKKTSIEEIAQQAGLGKGTIYLYFKSKDEIFRTLARHVATSLMAAIEESLEPLTSPSEKLRVFIFTRLRFFDKLHKDFGLTAERVIENHSYPALHEIKAEFGKAQIGVLRAIIDEGKNSGDFRSGDSELMAMAIFNALEGCGMPWNIHDRELDIEEKINATVGLFLNGLVKR